MARRPATTPRKNASQDRSKATVDALLAATARVLVKEGYDRASTNKIADAAGVSIGSLYQYFPTKESLVAAVMRRHSGEMMEVLRSSFVRVASMPLTEAVPELIRVYIEAHRIEPKLHRVLVEQIPRIGTLEEIESIDEEARAMVRAYLSGHLDEVKVRDVDLAAFVSVTCVEALTHVVVLRRPELIEDDAFVEEVSTLIVRYLRGGPLPAILRRE
jgi:AcrR family transcriptional regulator